MNFYTIVNLRGLRTGANSHDVSRTEKQLGIQLPGDYVQFLMFSDGCLLESGLSLYSLQDLVERNQTYEIFEYTPGYLLVGDDSGGLGILLSLDANNKNIYTSGLGDLSVSGFKVIMPSFQRWVDVKLSL